MNAIIGFSELLIRKVKDEEYTSYLNSIKSSSHSLLSLINDILDLSKVEAGKLNMEYDFIDLQQLANEMETLFAIRVEEKGLNYKIELNLDGGNLVYLDETRLRQVLINLVGNAIKFTEKGNVTLRITNRPKEGDLSKDGEVLTDLVIEVEDTGIGIKPDSIEKIFAAFTQQEGQSTKKYGGTGLGLAISEKLVRLMGGGISVKSEVDKGSCFQVRFDGIQSSFTESTATISDQKEADIRFEKALVLVIDDNHTNREFLAETLKEFGLDSLQAENGEDGLALLKKILPGLVITDLRMPVMDGFEFVRTVRATEHMRDLRIVATTASVTDEIKWKYKDYQFDQVLLKPIQIDTLIGILKQFLPFTSLEASEPGAPSPRREKQSERLGDLLPEIERQLIPGWEKLKVQQRMVDVQAFAGLLISFGTEHGLDRFVSYGNQLNDAVKYFDIDLILNLIKGFKKNLEIHK